MVMDFLFLETMVLEAESWRALGVYSRLCCEEA